MGGIFERVLLSLVEGYLAVFFTNSFRSVLPIVNRMDLFATSFYAGTNAYCSAQKLVTTRAECWWIHESQLRILVAGVQIISYPGGVNQDLTNAQLPPWITKLGMPRVRLYDYNLASFVDLQFQISFLLEFAASDSSIAREPQAQIRSSIAEYRRCIYAASEVSSGFYSAGFHDTDPRGSFY